LFIGNGYYDNRKVNVSASRKNLGLYGIRQHFVFHRLDGPVGKYDRHIEL
jgi:hypothetical protein